MKFLDFLLSHITKEILNVLLLADIYSGVLNSILLTDYSWSLAFVGFFRLLNYHTKLFLDYNLLFKFRIIIKIRVLVKTGVIHKTMSFVYHVLFNSFGKFKVSSTADTFHFFIYLLT